MPSNDARVRAGARTMPSDDVALLRLARAGSMEAAGVLVARHASDLLPRAIAIAGSRADGEDLLANAILRLLAAWRSGSGPDTNVAGYLVRTMTNARIDQARSPSSRVRSLDAALEDGVPLPDAGADAEAVRVIDLSAEFSIVRRGFARLPADYQRLLRETVVNGRRPAELVEELGRGAPAISSMQLRAKRALRRGVLVEQLAEGGDDCRQNAETLPDAVADEWSGHASGDRGLAHVRSCERCRTNWSRFARLAAGLGVVPAFVLVEIALPPAAAGAGGSARATRRLARRGVAVAAASAIGVGGAGVAIAVVLGASDPTGLPIGPRAGIAEPVTQRADLSASVTTPPGGEAIIDIAFSVPAAPWWRIDAVSIALPAGARVVEVPDGWACVDAPGGAACEVDEESPTGGVLRIEDPDGPVRGAFAIRIEASTTASIGIRGDVTGRIR